MLFTGSCKQGFWEPHLKQSLIRVVERLSVQAIQNLRDTFLKDHTSVIDSDFRTVPSFPGNFTNDLMGSIPDGNTQHRPDVKTRGLVCL